MTKYVVSLLFLLCVLISPAAALTFQSFGTQYWLCDGQWRVTGEWTADRAYMLRKARVWIGPDLYGTTEFAAILYVVRNGQYIPLAMDMGERAGLTGYQGTTGSNVTDRFIESLSNVPIVSGERLVLYATCTSYFDNPVFNHPVSYVQTSGYLWFDE